MMKRRCQWILPGGKQCIRTRGASKYCTAHLKESVDLGRCSRHDAEIVLPVRDRFEWQGNEASLTEEQ
jgi:hypothetical protein